MGVDSELLLLHHLHRRRHRLLLLDPDQGRVILLGMVLAMATADVFEVFPECLYWQTWCGVFATCAEEAVKIAVFDKIVFLNYDLSIYSTSCLDLGSEPLPNPVTPGPDQCLARISFPDMHHLVGLEWRRGMTLFVTMDDNRETRLLTSIQLFG